MSRLTMRGILLICVPFCSGIFLMTVIGTTSEKSFGINSEQMNILHTSDEMGLSATLIYHVSYMLTAFVEKLSFYNVTLTVILAMLTYIIHRELFHPYQLVRNFGDAGYITDGRNKKEVANEIRKRRRAGDVPPVYPNGWFSLLRSWELKTGDVKYVSALGQELAVFRGGDGQAYIVDAYCPHLGANLGVGGQVKGDCLECPFHGWVFKGSDGKCVDIPYTKKVPDFAKTRAWKCREVNGEIFMWFHAEGQEPDWYPPAVEGIANGTMKYHGYTEHYVNAHCEEIPENGADIAHLYHLHTPFLAAGRDLRFQFTPVWKWIKHAWTGGWEQDEDDKHVGILTLHHSIEAFGWTLPLTSLKAVAHQIGPGVTYLRIYLPIIGEICMMHCVTPVEPLIQRLTHTVYAPWFCPRLIAKFVMRAEAMQVERDLMIWNHKMFLSKPLLMKEDSTITKHRRWYSQFYSENSPRYNARKEGLDW